MQTIKVITHVSVDLDAVCSVWAYKRAQEHGTRFEMVFKPANWVPETEDDKKAVILDMDSGLKGDPSCFGEIINKYWPTLKDWPLVDYVNIQDNKGRANEILSKDKKSSDILATATLTAVLVAFKNLYGRDERVLEEMEKLLDGLSITHQLHKQGVEAAKKAEWIGTVAISRNLNSPVVNGILFGKGAIAVIYIDGPNLGIVKGSEGPSLDIPALIDYIKKEEGWYIHPKGFLVARGTRKSPVTTPSKLDVERIAKIIHFNHIGNQ